MSGIVPAGHHFTNLTGKLVLSISGAGVHTLANLAEDSAADLESEIRNLLAEGRGGRLVIQYTPGPDEKEAGSRWLDYQGTPESLQDAADGVIAHLATLDLHFGAGETFVG